MRSGCLGSLADAATPSNAHAPGIGSPALAQLVRITLGMPMVAVAQGHHEQVSLGQRVVRARHRLTTVNLGLFAEPCLEAPLRGRTDAVDCRGRTATFLPRSCRWSRAANAVSETTPAANTRPVVPVAPASPSARSAAWATSLHGGTAPTPHAPNSGVLSCDPIPTRGQSTTHSRGGCLASRRKPMICSSLKRFFTSNLLLVGDWTPNCRATQNRGASTQPPVGWLVNNDPAEPRGEGRDPFGAVSR